MYRKLECSLYVFLNLGWFIGCQVLTISLVKLFWGLDRTSFLNNYDQHMYKINVLIQVVYIMGIFVWDGIKRENTFNEYKYFENKKIILYIFYGIGLWVISSIINLLLSSIFTDYEMQIKSLFSNTEVIFRFLVLVILAPLVEEYLFRGKIQSTLKKSFGIKTAIIVQAVLFGMIHAINMQKIYAAFLGIVLGAVKEREKNLQSSTIMHMTINLISLVIATIP